MTYPPEYPDDGICTCCEIWHPHAGFDHLYGSCSPCAECQSHGHCYEGEDKPENTICCHGTRGAGDPDDHCAKTRKTMYERHVERNAVE